MIKTILFLTLASNLIFAQNSDLFNNNWYISQIVTNNQTTISPTMQVSIGTSHFNSNTNFVSSYFNTAGSMITFNTLTDSFTRQGGGCTLAVYNGTNAAAAQAYDQKNCDFFINTSSGTIFNYQIINNSNLKTLIITNATTGDKIYYNNSFLGTKENALKKTFKVYPNPSSDFLIVEDLEKNLKVKIYDLSGKLLFETLSSGKTLKVDVSNFQKGQYLLNIENFKSEFFIKN
ncbi:T9SS type A sorting domain-containing protein [Chryseobacterium luquanense]|uniref:T9SS type A sorting domain-containing protein n=1 Tax=Chryseobacterium luquanense TaxID=2983766 RepID=A0ABT3Y3E4_9FLAO|nr:T9SS type A sorting domain-containing protein [Chryseobacterium luquanense]MCX8532624.1 T9SS type A sorting domain-containing protein [Chryseobacterium luquanense]